MITNRFFTTRNSMHKLFIKPPLFLILLLNTIHSYTMQPSADFSCLSDLHPRIGSLTDPETIGNLSLTCRQLNETISFQTPHIWNIVCHSLQCISKHKMPELLIKARLCGEKAATDKEKNFFGTIEQHILACYNPANFRSYLWEDKTYETTPFDQFLAKERPLFSACFTGDKKIVIDALNSDRSLKEDKRISLKELNNLMSMLIHREKIMILPMICEEHAKQLESLFLNNKDQKFYWHSFFGNIAILHKKYKAFETLINYYKKYLVLPDTHNRTYSDFLTEYENDWKNHADYNGYYKDAFQTCRTILMLYITEPPLKHKKRDGSMLLQHKKKNCSIQ